MSKNLYIDASHPNETRVVLKNNNHIEDYEYESVNNTLIKNNIYLGKVSRIEPSLQAAFVDFGRERHGFLPLTEIHPDYFKIPAVDEKKIKEISDRIFNTEANSDELTENTNENEIAENNLDDVENDDSKSKIEEDSKYKTKKNNPKKEYFNFFKKYKIQDVIRPRQVILVQVNKEERGLKGAALTTYLSFAGRYCVLMPNSMNNDGISRKIGDIEERKKLKQILSTVQIPHRMSVIVRTAGIGRTKKEISKDLTFLVSQWNKIRELTLKSEAPKIIYEEGSVLKRAIRDMLTEDVEKILVDGKEGYEKVKKIAKNIVPVFAKKIKQFKSKENSLFAENNIETQINELFSLNVKLNSGGSIVINTTEALVAIDVNSGKNTSERNIESTALKTNLEAAVEIARQLRLRDLGGLVVIDFIDMDDFRNNFKVEKALKTALVRDRARVQFGRISMFGLMELSRQRLRSSLIDKSFEKCNFCKGSGLILNASSISDQIIKVIKEKLSDNKNSIINVKCNNILAENLLNLKKNEIVFLENNYESKINFQFNSLYSLHEPVIDLEEDKNDFKDTNNEEIKITKKDKIVKKTISSKKRKIVKAAKLSKKKTKIKDEENNQKNITEDIKQDDNQEKSGWWS